ncbi:MULTISPECIES: nucleotide sugar dehydrogenase [unclassified Streptomyces]|uniref:nucleotide sugar dehydrogenase n=1 Tax=unclassified Streptomyces TaxID=2593676 RepID=UPI001F51C1DD|nr:nucleotide sugar dehydrogenase [Streptomyces sp. TSRI0107]
MTITETSASNGTTDPEALRGTTVAVVGLGYVGLPTALALWSAGATIIGVDTSDRRIAAIRAGTVDLLPAQHATLACVENTGDFRMTSDASALRDANAVVVCVPTPVTQDHAPDLTALRAACETVVENAVPGQLIVLTSTSHVGTTRELLLEPLAARGLRAEEDVFVAFSPERIDPGNERHLPENTPRIVGGAGPLSTRAATALLGPTASRLHEVAGPETAEMAKLWENIYRAVNIALANELSDACVHLGLAPIPVIEAAATKPYGFMPFYPGPGAGGHCIPCDPYYLLGQLPSAKSAPLLRTAMAALRERPAQIAAQAAGLLDADGLSLVGARVLVLGVAYKAGVSDVRESPALRLIELLAGQGAEVSYSDCHVPALTVAGRTLTSVPDPEDTGWDLVVLHTAHPGADLGWLDAAPRVLDTRRRLHARTGAR